MKLVRTTSKDFVPVSFSSLIDQFFNDAMVRDGGSTFQPAVDLAETDKGFEVQLSVPGMNKEDFNLEILENRLTISGERKWSKENSGKNFHRVETQYGSFSRSFLIPEQAASTGIEATYQHGILRVFIPKDEQKALRTSIKVN